MIDLPNAGQVGTLEDARQSFIDAEAIPRAGFWLELLGALGLALSGGALATMSPEQLASLRGNFFRRGEPKEKAPAARERVEGKRGDTASGGTVVPALRQGA